MTHYDTLEVSPKASPEVIRAAYKSLVQRFHPDRNTGDPEAAQRTSQIVSAYEILSDVALRAAYDTSQLQATGQVAPAMAQWTVPDVAETAGGSAGRTPRGAAHGATRVRGAQSPGAGWGVGMTIALMLGVVLGGVWWFAARGPAPNPVTELAVLRNAMGSDTTPESERRALYTRKLAVLLAHPQLQHAEAVARAEDIAQRTFALLPVSLSVRISGPQGADQLTMELTLPTVNLLVGSFDSPRLLAHMDRHRERLVEELAGRLAQAGPLSLTGQEGGKRIENLIRQSVSASLGHGEIKAYPSTYFESPGRYGVVGVSLPEGFTLLQLKASL